MNLNVDQIVADKLAQLERDGTIQKKIEDVFEKTILSAVSDALSDYKLKRSIQDQLVSGVSSLAENCGLTAYNGFIAEKAALIVRECYSEDFAAKVRKALDEIMVKKYTEVKLSDIFDYYRKWVCEHTEEAEKYDREYFTGTLDVAPGSYSGQIITARFADHQIKEKCRGQLEEDPEVEIKIVTFGDKKHSISQLYMDGHNMENTMRIGYLSEFQQYILNLYFNMTPIVLDVDQVDDSDRFDVDY